jgi:hypothetical protein
VEHIDPEALDTERPESQALLAIRDACREFDDEPSVGLLFERLQGSQWLELVLRAHRYGEEIRFSAEEAETEFTEALVKLDLGRRKKELDQLRAGGLASREEQLAWQEKNLAYKRLQGALPSP